MRVVNEGRRTFLSLAVRRVILATLGTWIVACGSSAVSGPPASVTAPGTSASAATPAGPQGGAHTTAIKVCGLVDEPSISTLVGFPAKEFGPGDPVARVPIADRATTTANGAAIRIAYCGYWETGVKPEVSRDMTIEVTQGDPAKPGSWSSDAAHGQFTVLQTNAAAQQPQTVAGLGDEAFVTTSNGTVNLRVRSGDLVLQVEGDSPPGATVLTVDTLKGVVQAVLAKL